MLSANGKIDTDGKSGRGASMLIHVPKQMMTTFNICAAIMTSDNAGTSISVGFGMTAQTIYKWRKLDGVGYHTDMPHCLRTEFESAQGVAVLDLRRSQPRLQSGESGFEMGKRFRTSPDLCGGQHNPSRTRRREVLCPQQTRGDNAQSCWNWFSRGDQQRDRGEPTILAGKTREVMAEFGISRDRTFVVGLSAGAAMAVILGETYPDVFAAVGAHSGLPFGAATDVPSAFAAMAGTGPQMARAMHGKPTPRTIVFHGSADATVHPANGDRIAQSVLDRSAPQTIQTDEKGNISGRNFTRKITSNAGDATALEHWVLEGLGHAWSGGQPQGSYTDLKGPDASAEMIRFFFEADGGQASCASFSYYIPNSDWERIANDAYYQDARGLAWSRGGSFPSFGDVENRPDASVWAGAGS